MLKESDSPTCPPNTRPPHTAQEGPGCAVRLGGHAAGIGNDHVGPGGAQSRAQAAMPQFGAYDLAVSPAGTAAEVLNVVFCHVVSLKAVSQLRWPDRDREVWFSLGENHEKAYHFGLHQLRNWPNQGNAISGRIPSGALDLRRKYRATVPWSFPHETSHSFGR